MEHSVLERGNISSVDFFVFTDVGLYLEANCVATMRKNPVRDWFLRIAGYFVPLFQSLPPLGVWTGLMTVPLISYLVMLFSSIPESLPIALEDLFTDSAFLLDKTCIVIGLLILCYSSAYLRINRNKGLIVFGPYQLVRHPQYLGIILFTLGLTTRSYWILTKHACMHLYAEGPHLTIR
nr:hypothetical protein [Candidatus Njordarchaeum guaymaensis]